MAKAHLECADAFAGDEMRCVWLCLSYLQIRFSVQIGRLDITHPLMLVGGEGRGKNRSGHMVARTPVEEAKQEKKRGGVKVGVKRDGGSWRDFHWPWFRWVVCTSGSEEESRMRSAGKYWSLSTFTTSPTLIWAAETEGAGEQRK